TGVVDAEWRVRLRRTAVVSAGGGKADLPHRHPHVRVEAAGRVNLGRGREAVVAASRARIGTGRIAVPVAALATPLGGVGSNCHRTPPAHSEAAAPVAPWLTGPRFEKAATLR